MNIQPGFFGRLFAGAARWHATIDGDHLVMRQGEMETRHPLSSIRQVDVSHGVLWSAVIIQIDFTPTRLGGLIKGQANSFRHMLRKSIAGSLFRTIKPASDTLPALSEAMDAFYRQPGYLANRDVTCWQDSLGDTASGFRLIHDTLRHPLFDASLVAESLKTSLLRLQDLLAGKRQELQARNEAFVLAEMKAWKHFFDSVESRPLTEEQQRAAIVLEDRNLLIAAAGSGKSSTVVAKIGYALATRFCQSHEILALAFNRSAAAELDARIEERLGDLVGDTPDIASRTFHRLGMDIIAAVEGKQVDLAPWANETRDNEGKVIEEIVQALAETDRGFLERWVRFQAICFRPNKELTRFATQQDYDAYLRQVGEDRNGHKGIRTLNGELVKSMEELAIANWLFMNGIPYEYERTYAYETADQHHRQYHPDFYFPEIDCYHEHFALDTEGKAPAIFAGDYEEGVRWKRMLHAEKQTALIETTSAMYRAGTLFLHLEHELKSRQQAFHPCTPQAILECLAAQKQPTYAGFIRTFITLCKSRNLLPGQLAEKAELQRDRFRALAFLDVVGPVFQRYQEKLSEIGCVDFEDMIRTATRYVEEQQYIHPYRLILVDEFQDIAHGRAALIQAMLRQHPDCRLFAVGDDWQSIYRFTGSDIGIMSRFPQHFGVSATNYLTQTFRSNQGITNVAAAFVQANPAQLRKTVHAVDKTHEATVQILEYGKDEEVDPQLESELQTLAEIAKAEKRILRVFLLARYNHLRPASVLSWKKRFASTLQLEFLSLHRSKGLEADYVFILGVNSGTYAFPGEIMDDPLLDLVLPVPESFENAEERRLFYVGLTRAKRRTYLLTKKSRMSKFIPELIKAQHQGAVVYRSSKAAEHSASVLPCPSCGTGVLREISGPYGPFMGCSNYPACTAKRKLPDLSNRKTPIAHSDAACRVSG
jgi:DNA helicase IV